MKRAVPWVIAVVALIAFAASYSELQRMRVRFGEVTRHKFHDHQDVRRDLIRLELSTSDRPIVVIGDSLTEMARFPESIDGRPVVNAGIGGITIAEYVPITATILDGHSPSLIVLCIGANDRGSTTIASDYTALLESVRRFAPVLVSTNNPEIVKVAKAAGVHVVPIPDGPKIDDVHLTSAASKLWVKAIVAQITLMM